MIIYFVTQVAIRICIFDVLCEIFVRFYLHVTMIYVFGIIIRIFGGRILISFFRVELNNETDYWKKCRIFLINVYVSLVKE